MLQPALPRPSPQQSQRPSLPSVNPLWQRPKLKEHLASLLQNVAVLRALGEELEAIQTVQALTPALSHGSEPVEAVTDESSRGPRTLDLEFKSVSKPKETLLKTVQETCKLWPESVSFATQAAKQLQDVIKLQLQPLHEVLDGNAASERASAVRTLASKRQKLLRNRKWRGRKRRRVAEALQKERDRYEEADREADEWRAKEIAKSIAKRKMERMKALAEKKAKEEKARCQEEMETVLLVEKLKELRGLRVAKLKKLGRFFPEEDDQFLEKVRAAVAEEERQAAAAANTSAAATAILNAEEARKVASGLASSSKCGEMEEEKTAPPYSQDPPLGENEDQSLENKADLNIDGESLKVSDKLSKVDSERKSSRLLEGYEGLPTEFHHYYLGSSYDMGTLIEDLGMAIAYDQVRQGWDAFIMPGGSRIPRHWIEAPPPGDAVWASYLVKPKSKKRHRRRELRE